MKPIMLATDGSPTAEEATRKAIELATVFRTELVIMTAWDIPYSSLGYAAVPPLADLMEVSKEQAEKVAEEAAGHARDAGVRVQTCVLRGFPIEEICLAAEKLSPEILVIGSHGWGPMKRMIFGSVSTGVLHHVACPVLVVPLASLEGAGQELETRAEVTAKP